MLRRNLCSFLSRSYYTGCKTRLLKALQHQLSISTSQIALSDTQETFKSKQFEVICSNNSISITLQKKLNDGKIVEVHFNADPTEDFDDLPLEALSEAAMSQVREEFLRMKQEKVHVQPLKFQVCIQKGNEVNINECTVMDDKVKIKDSFVTPYPISVPLVNLDTTCEENRGIVIFTKPRMEECFKAYLRDNGVDKNLLKAASDMSFEYNKQLEINWIENVIRIISDESNQS